MASLEQQIPSFSELQHEEQKKIVLHLLEILRKYGDPFDVIDDYIRTWSNIEASDLLEVYTAITQATEEQKILENSEAMKRLQDIKGRLLMQKEEEKKERKQSQQEADMLLSHL